MTAAPAARLGEQFWRFCIVGAAAFVVDAGIAQALVSWAAWNAYLASGLSYLAAATAAWWLNRRFTFGASQAPAHREWATYLVVNASGGAVNVVVRYALIGAFETVRAWPWIGVAAGSVAGLLVNFAANKWYVFRRKAP